MADVQIDELFGNCPVQAYGTVAGRPFYFRARGDRWTFGVGDGGCAEPGGEVAWSHEEEWVDAGWMNEAQARACIEKAAGLYLVSRGLCPPHKAAKAAPVSTVRPLLAWIAAAILSAALGASLSIGLVYAFGFWEWPFLGWVWLGLTGAGSVFALVGGGPIAFAATFLARWIKPPRPLADMLLGAVGALGLLLAMRWLAVSRFGHDDTGFLPAGFGPILVAPLFAGAACGWLYWRLAGKPPHPEPDEE